MADEPLFLDTNVWLRFLVGDDAAKADACRRLLERASRGEVELTANEIVLAEIEWTLRSFYRLPKPDVVERLWAVLRTPGLQLPRRALLETAVELYERHPVDFVDAYHAAELGARRLTTVVSYDRDFDLLGVTRVEP